MLRGAQEGVDSQGVHFGEEQGHPVFETEGKLISLGVDVGNLWGLGKAVGLKL